MRVFAFAHHAPDEIVIKLRKNGIDRADIFLVGEEELIKRKNPRNHYVFMSVLSFYKNRDTLETLDVVSYVCDDPISLSQYRGFTPADYKVEEFFHVDGFSLTPMRSLDNCPNNPVFREKFDIIETCAKIAKQQITFLNQFMTFVYSLPSETHQKPVKELVCKWMASTETVAQYCKRLEKQRESVHLSDKQVKRLVALVSSDTAQLYRDALQMPGPADVVARTMKISAYELRYIRAINTGPKKAAVK